MKIRHFGWQFWQPKNSLKFVQKLSPTVFSKLSQRSNLSKIQRFHLPCTLQYWPVTITYIPHTILTYQYLIFSVEFGMACYLHSSSSEYLSWYEGKPLDSELMVVWNSEGCNALCKKDEDCYAWSLNTTDGWLTKGIEERLWFTDWFCWFIVCELKYVTFLLKILSSKRSS